MSVPDKESIVNPGEFQNDCMDSVIPRTRTNLNEMFFFLSFFLFFFKTCLILFHYHLVFKKCCVVAVKSRPVLQFICIMQYINERKRKKYVKTFGDIRNFQEDYDLAY